FLNNTEDKGRDNEPTIEVPTDLEAKRRAEIRGQLDKLKSELNAPRPALAARQEIWERGTLQRIQKKEKDAQRQTKPPSPSKAPMNDKDIPDSIAKILAIARNKRDAKQVSELQAHYRSIAPEFAPLRQRISLLE